MRLSSVIAIAAIAASPTNASSIMHKAGTAATNSVEKAKLLALEQGQNRRTADAAADLNNLVLILFCGLFELGQGISDMIGDVEIDDSTLTEARSKECSMGCDDDQTSMIVSCTDAVETCDDTNEFCIEDNTIKSVIILADMEKASTEVEACSTYTKAPYPELVEEKSCITLVGEMDLNMAMAPGTDLEDIIAECGFTVGDTVCQCSLCDGNNEISLICPSLGFQSEGCINMEEDLTFIDGDVSESSVPVIRFAEVTSSAIVVTPSVVIFSFALLTLAALF